MTERCHNCGAGLYAGQQFCRRCGVPVAGRAGGEAPTQLFPQGAPTSAQAGAAAGQPAAGTLPLGGAGTDSVAQARSTGHQQPLQSFQQTAPLAAQPPARGRKRGAGIIALVVLACVGALVSLGIVLAISTREPRERKEPVVVVKKVGGRAAPGAEAMPPVPPDMPERIMEAVVSAGVPLPLDEQGAAVTAGETVITKTYKLDDEAAFSLKSLRGDISIEGWESDEAQVKIIKRGGSPDERRAVPVLASSSEEALALTSPTADGEPVSVAYEVKLPRGTKQVQVSSGESRVKVSGLEGTVVVDVRGGELEFRDVPGSVRGKLTKGRIKVFYGESGQTGAQEFSAVRGDVEVDFADAVSADVKAETMDGEISADAALGVNVEKRPAGQHAVGRLGDGDEQLLIKVVNGDIKLKK